jgi:SAM-dependent methyltransferase
VLGRIGTVGKAVAQLCCNDGRELISVERMGARDCVGFDLADSCIAEARALAAEAGARCRFEQANILALPPEYDGRFDLGLVTVGALGWFPQVQSFFAAAARILTAGGQLFVHEQHPLVDSFELTNPEQPLLMRQSYFRVEPFKETGGLDYYGDGSFGRETNYWFPHTLSDVIGGALRAGFQLLAFEELAHDPVGIYGAVTAGPVQPPLSYTLVLRRQGC